MCHERKVKNRHPTDPEVAEVNQGIPSRLYLYGAASELPLRVRKIARRNRAMVYDVVIRASLVHNSARESEGIGCSQNDVSRMRFYPDRSDYLVETADFCLRVVSSVRCFNVLVVHAAFHQDVPLQSSVSGVCVVGCLIGPDITVAIVNLAPRVKFVDLPLFLLRDRANRRLFRLGVQRSRIGTM